LIEVDKTKFIRDMIFLNDGEVVCDKCNGELLFMEDVYCKKCSSTGKVD